MALVIEEDDLLDEANRPGTAPTGTSVLTGQEGSSSD